MPQDKILAKDWDFEINTGTIDTPIWTQINGIESWSPSFGDAKADISDMDDDWDRHLIASRNASITLDGKYIEDSSTGDRDPGQEAVETLGKAVGEASIGQFRVTSPGGNTWTFSASVSPGNRGGGGRNDPSAWSMTLNVSGAIAEA